MKLTVGPLPPAVYWRRRAMVAGVIVLIAIFFLYSCSGSGSGSSDAAKATSQRTAGAASPSPTASSPRPVIVGSAEPTPDSPTTAAPTSGNCSDGEVAVLPEPELTKMPRGTVNRLTLKIKNISGRTCSRDVGADAQELFIVQVKTKIWSSDACGPSHGVDVRSFAPGGEALFFVTWQGNTTSGGCLDTTPPLAGVYQLVGRLGNKMSEPVALTITN